LDKTADVASVIIDVRAHSRERGPTMPNARTSAATQPEPTEEAGMTIDELPVKVRLRVEHAGRWVAWAEDDQSVIAAADTYEEVREAARRAGFPRAVCEWLEPVPIRPLGR
jgi:hypothetical protein